MFEHDWGFANGMVANSRLCRAPSSEGLWMNVKAIRVDGLLSMMALGTSLDGPPIRSWSMILVSQAMTSQRRPLIPLTRPANPHHAQPVASQAPSSGTHHAT